MTTLLAFFLAIAAVLWLSVFGYLLALVVVARGRTRPAAPLGDFPDVAVIVPTLNEQDLIVSKLANLERSDYPRERLAIVVVDGGSSDATISRVEEAMARDPRIRLLRVPGARGLADQVHHALSHVDHELAVVTDADAELEPSCIRELVRVLASEPGTAIVGALIQPRTNLLEEKIHWWMLNRLWWLEGEALSSAMVSGSCFALRRKSVFPLCEDARMHDVNLALVASARGFRVRLCREAVACDVRAPQNARDLVRFRLRRGRYYVSELRRSSDEPPRSPSWRLVHGIRLWHFLVSPVLVTLLLVLGTGLLWTPAWPWPFATLAAFVAPAGAALLLSTSLRGPDGRPWTLVVAAARLVALTWFSLFALHRRAPAPSRGRIAPDGNRAESNVLPS